MCPLVASVACVWVGCSDQLENRPLYVIVSILIVGIVVLFVISVAFVRHRRRKRHRASLIMQPVVDYKSPQTVHLTSGQDPDALQLNIISHESYVPDAPLCGTIGSHDGGGGQLLDIVE